MKIFQSFRDFVTIVETQIGKKVKCLRFDNGGQYVSKAFQQFCDTKGIKREFIAVGAQVPTRATK